MPVIATLSTDISSVTFLNTKSLSLTDTANVNSKPELEIYADDVKCSHGSTTGQIDEEAIFLIIGADHIPILKHLFESNPYFEVVKASDWLEE